MPAIFRVVLDANVLFPFSLRDTLLRAADAGYFQLYWSEGILAEAERNLVSRGHVTAEKAERLFSTMKEAFPEAMVVEHEPLIDRMPNEAKDRHVAAAAVKAGAQVIVTFNTKDFRTLPQGIEAQSPDAFLTNILDLDASSVLDLLRRQAQALKKPAKSLEQLLEGLAKTVPDFVTEVRSQQADDGPLARPPPRTRDT